MKELSLHILDLAENSINANANLIQITVYEDIVNDRLLIEIEDDGCGMDDEVIKRVTDPFFTTRKTRKVGLGLSLMKVAATRCDGDFKIISRKGKGTKVACFFRHSHIDRAPLGDMGQTIITLINYKENIDIRYKHIVNDSEFVFDTREIREILGDIEIKHNGVILWIKEYINEHINALYNYEESL